MRTSCIVDCQNKRDSCRSADATRSEGTHRPISDVNEVAENRMKLICFSFHTQVIDNSTDFDTKMRRLIDCVCRKIGVPLGDRFAPNSRKIKFLVKRLPADDSVFPTFQDFEVRSAGVFLPEPRKNSSETMVRGRHRIMQRRPDLSGCA